MDQEEGQAPSSGPSRRNGSEEERQQRAPQACVRCRRKKLRCAGGHPCARCVRARETCDFGDRNNGYDALAGLNPSIRIAQLEKTVASLLSDLASVRTEHAISDTASNNNVSSYSHGYSLPIPSIDTTMTIMSPPDPSMPFSNSAGIPREQYHFDQIPPIESMRASSSLMVPPPPPPPPPTKESPEGRLAVALQNGKSYSAPFQPLTYKPNLWENREPSRQASPQPGLASREETWPVFEGKAGPKDDPLTNALISEDMAHTLFNLFLDKCHLFLPIVHFFRRDVSPFQELRQRCSYLFTTVLAIAARFYRKWQATKASNLVYLTSDQASGIARLAYSHLAASMFRKQHQLGDVQATLLLAAWGLEAGGGGPDPWMITGHVGRLAHRLGLHRVGGMFVQTSERGDESQQRRRLASWRTWLCWIGFDGFLSLGFGRPPSHCVEGLYESVFLQNMSENKDSDLYILALLELSKIAREFVHWTQGLCSVEGCEHQEEHPADSLRHRSLAILLRDINNKLDIWTQRWTWIGSNYAVQMGTKTQILRLLCDQVRLSLNSMALKPSASSSEMNGRLELAPRVTQAMEAAIHTISTHTEAAERDMLLSFCFDYITISLGQAAIFLIRLHGVRETFGVEPGVIIHYLQIAVDLLGSTDLSETKNSSYLGRVCRDLARVAGIPLTAKAGTERSPLDMDVWANNGQSLFTTDDEIASFLQLDGGAMDMGLWFGMPADPMEWASAGDFDGQV